MVNYNLCLKVIYIAWLIKKEFMKRSVRQTGVLKRLLFLRRRALELAIGGSRLASLWCSLLTISSNNFIDNESRLSESVGIPVLSKAGPKFKFHECLFTLLQDNPQQHIYQTYFASQFLLAITKVRGKSIRIWRAIPEMTSQPIHEPLSAGTVSRSTWLGVAEAGTLNLDFGVKKCPNRKIIFGTFIYV